MLKNQRHGGQGDGQLDGVIHKAIFQILAHPPEHPPPGFILEPQRVDFSESTKPAVALHMNRELPEQMAAA